MLSEFELKKIERTIGRFIEKRRPPAHIRDKVDLNFRIENQSIIIYESRAHWQNNSKRVEVPVAKATYVKTKKVWKIFWRKSDMKWHGYEPTNEVKELDEFANVVDEDKYGCFFG